jgi:hypothetical protein
LGLAWAFLFPEEIVELLRRHEIIRTVPKEIRAVSAGFDHVTPPQ